VRLAIEALIVLAVLLLAFFLPGCSVRQVRADPPAQRFWNGCQETAPAIADGFQHFVCVDTKSKEYEVLVRPRPKR
jgi:hypothetical protein